jgi:hypothetical protein
VPTQQQPQQQQQQQHQQQQPTSASSFGLKLVPLSLPSSLPFFNFPLPDIEPLNNNNNKAVVDIVDEEVETNKQGQSEADTVHFDSVKRKRRLKMKKHKRKKRRRELRMKKTGILAK